jgi:hypothetical protein
MLTCSADAQLPLRIVTLLLPVGDSGASPPQITTRSDPRGAISALTFELTGERVEIDDESVTLTRAENATR